VVRAAYAFEASILELTWIAGPPLVLGVGALWSTGAALAAGGFVLLVATGAFAVQPASHTRPPRRSTARPRLPPCSPCGESDRSPAACSSHARAEAPAAPAGLVLLLAALAAGHLALIPASGGILSLGAVLLLAGAAIAPAEASVNAMVDDAAPPGTTTEAFAWLASAIAIGGALGTAASGTLTDRAGPTATFALAGGAGALAVLVAALRIRSVANPYTWRTLFSHDLLDPRTRKHYRAMLGDIVVDYLSG